MSPKDPNQQFLVIVAICLWDSFIPTEEQYQQHLRSLKEDYERSVSLAPPDVRQHSVEVPSPSRRQVQKYSTRRFKILLNDGRAFLGELIAQWPLDKGFRGFVPDGLTSYIGREPPATAMLAIALALDAKDCTSSFKLQFDDNQPVAVPEVVLSPPVWQARQSPSVRSPNEGPAPKPANPSAPRAAMSAAEFLPHDGIYSDPAGVGGNYRDPLHGFFEVKSPVGYSAKARQDKTSFTIGLDGPHAGEIVPSSWVEFRQGEATIIVVARKTYTTIEHDFELIQQDFEKRMGGTLLRARYVTMDGAKAGELVGAVRHMSVITLKYKKRGLDHAITITFPTKELSKREQEFLEFLCSYRSTSPE